MTAARERLEELGYEVLVFHQTGTGGESMEELMRGGFVTASLDVTTTELATSSSAASSRRHPKRLEVAGELGIPQVVSLGALDMVNFGPMDTVPEQFREPEPLRPQPDGDADANDARGVRRARPADRAQAQRGDGPDRALRPAAGVSMIAVEGQVFHDPAADEALFAALREHLDPAASRCTSSTLDVNDPGVRARDGRPAARALPGLERGR